MTKHCNSAQPPRPGNALGRRRGALLLGAALAASACGREATVTGFKTPGVGLDPGDIGPEPVLQNGLLELNRIEFGGGGLPLAIIGLVSYTGLEATGSADPPYAVVSGQGFVSEAPQPGMDVLFGTVGVPLDRVDTCYTQYEPAAFLSSLVDVGDAVVFDGEGFSMSIGRRPIVYPDNNMEQVRPYYSDFQPLRLHGLSHSTLGKSDALTDAVDELLIPANWRPGATVTVRFPGGLPPEEATFGAIPMPLAANGMANTHTLPQDLPELMLSWVGPAYQLDPATGTVAADADAGGGLVNKCFQFGETTDVPEASEDCASLALNRAENDFGQALPIGQIYTAPWSTESGLNITWSPRESESTSDKIIVGVRILGPVDFDDEYKRVSEVEVPATSHLMDRWESMVDAGFVSDDERPAESVTREALACESADEGEMSWAIDPTLIDESGEPVLGLQGEPSRVLAEVVCNVSDDGSFLLTPGLFDEALAYADQNEAAGAIFYVARTTATDLDTPDVRDRYGQRRPAEPVRVSTSTARFGRFHWDR